MSDKEMNIKEKMTIGKAKKILRGFLAKDCYYDTPLYYAIPYILEYINELQQELQRKDNIINELEEKINKPIRYIKENIMLFNDVDMTDIKVILSMLKED